MYRATFDRWFENLSEKEQELLITHIFEKKIGTPTMEGLFSGPTGKIDKGMFSGPTGRTNTRVCTCCGRPL